MSKITEKKDYDFINIAVKKDTRRKIKAFSKKKGKLMYAVVDDLIDKEIKECEEADIIEP